MLFLFIWCHSLWNVQCRQDFLVFLTNPVNPSPNPCLTDLSCRVDLLNSTLVFILSSFSMWMYHNVNCSDDNVPKDECVGKSCASFGSTATLLSWHEVLGYRARHSLWSNKSVSSDDFRNKISASLWGLCEESCCQSPLVPFLRFNCSFQVLLLVCKSWWGLWVDYVRSLYFLSRKTWLIVQTRVELEAPLLRFPDWDWFSRRNMWTRQTRRDFSLKRKVLCLNDHHRSCTQSRRISLQKKSTLVIVSFYFLLVLFLFFSTVLFSLRVL